MIKYFYLVFLSCFLNLSFSNAQTLRWKGASENPEFVHRSIKKVTDVIVHDIYSPPVASRTYAYITAAGYEVCVPFNNNYLSLAGQLHGLSALPKPSNPGKVSPALAASHAILMVGRSMVISEKDIDAFYQKILKEFKSTGMPAEVFNASLEFGKQVTDHILAWAAADQYKQTRSLPKYALLEDEDSWKPTPPAYLKAIEPHWNKIRTFVMDSAAQFKPNPPGPFSKEKDSEFFREAKKVYDAGQNLSAEQRAMANFWDCNPFKMNLQGHVMFATKKISPGGHWMNITRLACKKSRADLNRSIEAYVCVAITLAEGFISCWDEKYRSSVVRPETYINLYINPNWVPLLQTPPFPEYTSGHSVISMASSVILTRMFGERFSFADSTEVEFGLPVRKFSSFLAAAKEAAISRFYGGIHYMPAITEGMVEGEKIGKFVLERLETRKSSRVQKKLPVLP